MHQIIKKYLANLQSETMELIYFDLTFLLKLA